MPLYKSSDLIHWQYLHPLYQGQPGQDGGFCECPAFFPLGDKHVLLLSHQATYLVGRYADHRFVPECRGRLDYGGVYVPQSVLDAKGRRIVWGWVLETRGRDAQRQAGWAGLQTLPRILSLQSNGTLACGPPPELSSLRTRLCQFREIHLAAGATHILDGVQGGQLEIAAKFAPVQRGSVGLAVLAGPEKTEIVFDGTAGILACHGKSAPLPLGASESLGLSVFVDGSVIEVFANGRVCLTERIYPAHPEAIQIALIARGDAATATQVDAWTMGTIWPPFSGE